MNAYQGAEGKGKPSPGARALPEFRAFAETAYASVAAAGGPAVRRECVYGRVPTTCNAPPAWRVGMRLSASTVPQRHWHAAGRAQRDAHRQAGRMAGQRRQLHCSEQHPGLRADLPPLARRNCVQSHAIKRTQTQRLWAQCLRATSLLRTASPLEKQPHRLRSRQLLDGWRQSVPQGLQDELVH